MIFKMTWTDDQIDWCNAKDMLHLLKLYEAEYTLELQDIESIEEISDEQAKDVMVYNTDYDEDDPQDMPEYICLFDIRGGNEFEILASTEFLT